MRSVIQELYTETDGKAPLTSPSKVGRTGPCYTAHQCQLRSNGGGKMYVFFSLFIFLFCVQVNAQPDIYLYNAAVPEMDSCILKKFTSREREREKSGCHPCLRPAAASKSLLPSHVTMWQR